jgi:hypothetical protein
MAVRLSALRAGRPLPPGRFLVLICVRGWVDSRVIMRLKELGQLENKKSSDLIENRTRDFSACSIVPQPTTLPCAPILKSYKILVLQKVKPNRNAILTVWNPRKTRDKFHTLPTFSFWARTSTALGISCNTTRNAKPWRENCITAFSTDFVRKPRNSKGKILDIWTT